MKDMTTRLKSTYKVGILVAACMGLATTASCTDEEVAKGSSVPKTDKMNFSVSLTDKWNAVSESRSSGNNSTTCEDGGFNNGILCIASTVKDGIDHNPIQKTGVQTRGTTVDEGNYYSSFKMYAYAYEGTDWTIGSRDAYTYFDNETVVPIGGGVWATNTPRFWPNSGRMKFLAYAPSDMQVISTLGTTHTLDYTVPNDVKEQRDLLVAEQDEAGNYRQTLELNFRHILTAVKVVAHQHLGGSQGSIKSITFKNIKGRGRHVLGTKTWTTQGEGTNFTIDISSKAIKGGEMILDDEDETTLMMIPQTLDAGADLEIAFSEADGRGTVTGRIGGDGKTWEMGTTMIYRLPFVFLLKYDANGGQFNDNSMNITDKVISYDAFQNQYPIKNNKPTREGYEFIGWADAPNSQDATYVSGDRVTLFASDPIKIIYAVWREKERE